VLRMPIKRAMSAALSVYRAVVPYRVRVYYWAHRRRRGAANIERAQMRDTQFMQTCRETLKQIVSQYPAARGVVIFPPSIDWDTPLFQRPQQMALAFAALGYLVLYSVRADSPSELDRFHRVTDRLHVCRVPPAVYDVIEGAIAVAYTYSYRWARHLISPIVVYEMIDDLEIFTDYPLWLLRYYHAKLVQRAAVVVGCASYLHAKLIRRRPDALLCPNGVDFDRFAATNHGGQLLLPDAMRALVDEQKPIVGYYGALAEWFDFDLLKYAARALPHYSFVLIGPDYDGQGLRDSGISMLSNIHWLGPKPYAELPRYLACFDVATIPFKIDAALQAVSPIKLFEYMAGGRPVVTTDLTECRKYPVVRIARTPDEWVERLQEAVRLQKDPSHVAELMLTARQNTWTARAQQIVTALQATGRLREAPAEPTSPSAVAR
jgi:glycosyltransferase involved in cell wall biosynthesis